MNNMLKNLVIWLVIGLVLMTVFNQFNTRQAAQAEPAKPHTVIASMDDWNQKTHAKSGLIERVKASTLSERDVREAERERPRPPRCRGL